ncbi:MAG: amidohydrolase family protein [Oscillospiraceae bacterium]|jgi:predicted TIM-barrel fold metal-dependent hydrolase|nr:amidohydrolase family protein [Oscillospiraceae bacterium]
MIIDCHTHIYPQKIADKAVKYIGEFYTLSMHRDCSGTAEELLSEMDSAGIDRAAILAVSQAPDQTHKINEFAAATAAAHPRLFGLGTIHIEQQDILAEVEHIKSLGLNGLKLHPDMQKFNADDERLFPVFDLLSQYKLPLMLHAGDFRFGYSHPDRIKNICDNFPRLTVVAAHFGGWSMFDLAFEVLENTNAVVDTSSSFAFLGKRRSLELIRLYGTDRVMFGSDYPMWKPGDELTTLLSLGLSDTELERILHLNAERVFNL